MTNSDITNLSDQQLNTEAFIAVLSENSIQNHSKMTPRLRKISEKMQKKTSILHVKLATNKPGKAPK